MIMSFTGKCLTLIVGWSQARQDANNLNIQTQRNAYKSIGWIWFPSFIF